MANSRPNSKPAAVQFETFGSDKYIEWAKCKGALMIVNPIRIERGVKSNQRTSDVIVANIEVLDGECAGDMYLEQFVFPKGLFGQLKDRLGRTLLGRLGEGNPVFDDDGEPILDEETGEQKRPWKFLNATPEDVAAATAHVNARKPRAV